MSQPKLQYFGLAARAEPIRIICAVKGIKFEDERLDFPDFGARKAAGEFPMGSMPVWREDGMSIFQTNTIMRMLGQRNGMYAKDPTTGWAIDSILEYVEDEFNAWCGKAPDGSFGKPFPEGEVDALADFHGKLCVLIERRMKMHGKKWVGGTDDMSVADCKIAHMFYNNLFRDSSTLTAAQKEKLRANLAKYPVAEKYVDQTLRGALGAYLSTRPPVPC